MSCWIRNVVLSLEISDVYQYFIIVDEGNHPILPFAILTFSQLSVLSNIFTLEPSCKTNKSTLDEDGELFTVIVGLVIMPSL